MSFYLIAILALGVLIVVHEFGHFIVAKRLGVKVLKFSVGFGPTIVSRTVNGTEYALSAIPLGGFVKMAGEDPDAPADEPLDPTTSFSHAALWRRTAIVCAGPLFNFLFAWFAFWFAFWAFGAQVPNDSAKIGHVEEGRPAHRAGLQVGDVIIAVDGNAVGTWTEVAKAIRATKGRKVAVQITRNGQPLTLEIQAEPTTDPMVAGDEEKAYVIGIMQSSDRRPIGLFEAVGMGATQTYRWSQTIVVGLGMMLQLRVSPKEIGGVVEIVRQAKRTAEDGLEKLLHFTAIISINLAILNFLPIPVLDGGHLFFFLIEGVRRRPLELRHREIAQQVGLVVLVALMMLAFYNDIARVIRGPG